MNSAVADALGINPGFFHWVLVPLFIFMARIGDVSISTIRTILMLGGKRQIAPLLGFFESLIWLVAISQILQNIGNIVSYLAYPAGFATGIYIGMIIEEKLAIGKVIVRVITQKDAAELIAALKEQGFGLTILDAEGAYGKVDVIFTITKRKNLPRLRELIAKFNPKAFYTIEAVRYVNENLAHLPDQQERKRAFFRLLKR